MHLEDKIIEFLSVYPREFIRILSLWYKFSKQEIVKYGFILSWDNYGVLYNSGIEWDMEMVTQFSERIFNREQILFSKKNFNIIFEHENCLNATSIFIKKLNTRFEFSKLDSSQLLEIKDLLDNKEWRIVCRNYSFRINYDFLLNFNKYIDIKSLLFNSRIDWNDFRVIQFFDSDWRIAINYNLWVNIFQKHINWQTLPLYLQRLNKGKKVAKIICKYDKPINNQFKYLINIYVVGKYGIQVIASGYLNSQNNYVINKEYLLMRNVSFRIENGQNFNRIIL